MGAADAFGTVGRTRRENLLWLGCVGMAVGFCCVGRVLPRAGDRAQALGVGANHQLAPPSCARRGGSADGCARQVIRPTQRDRGRPVLL